MSELIMPDTDFLIPDKITPGSSSGLFQRFSGMEHPSLRKARKAAARLHKRYPYTLDSPFLQLGKRDALSLRDAFEHFLVTSETGGGKTSGPGTALPAAAMQMGFGLLVCCFKSDESARLVNLAKKMDRINSVAVIEPGGPWKMDFLSWEMSRGGGASVDSAVSGLMDVLENASPKGHRESKDAIWEEAPRRAMTHALLLLKEAQLPVTIDNLKAMLDGMPSSGDDGALIWPTNSLVQTALARAKSLSGDVSTVQTCEQYFCREMARPGIDKFAANVAVTITSMLDPFMRGPVKELFFSGETTITPDFWRRGGIVIVNLPITEYAAGKAAQILVKYSFFSHVLRRQGLPPGERPSMFFCDEYQTLMSRLDARLYEAGRSSLVSACCMTQNLPSMYGVLEAQRSHDQVDGMLGNWGCWIAGRNKCRITNQVFSDTVGQALTKRANGSVSSSESISDNKQYSNGHNSSVNYNAQQGGGSYGRNSSFSRSKGSSSTYGSQSGWREEMDNVVRKETFHALSAGPPKGMVETVLFKSGRKFSQTGWPYMYCRWPQK